VREKGPKGAPHEQIWDIDPRQVAGYMGDLLRSDGVRNLGTRRHGRSQNPGRRLMLRARRGGGV
jgi:hypothetical protein